ncbi:MAG: ArsR/SmtB family transcription factor [Thermoleophilia bacterium]
MVDERNPAEPAVDGGANVRADPVYVMKAQFFRVLGHPVRIRILELLSEREEMTVGELQSELKLDSGGTSQHLSALRQLGVLDNRRAGTNVHYRLRDPIVSELLAVARHVITSGLTASTTVLGTLAEEEGPPPVAPQG